MSSANMRNRLLYGAGSPRRGHPAIELSSRIGVVITTEGRDLHLGFLGPREGHGFSRAGKSQKMMEGFSP